MSRCKSFTCVHTVNPRDIGFKLRYMAFYALILAIYRAILKIVGMNGFILHP